MSKVKESKTAARRNEVSGGAIRVLGMKKGLE